MVCILFLSSINSTIVLVIKFYLVPVAVNHSGLVLTSISRNYCEIYFHFIKTDNDIVNYKAFRHQLHFQFSRRSRLPSFVFVRYAISEIQFRINHIQQIFQKLYTKLFSGFHEIPAIVLQNWKLAPNLTGLYQIAYDSVILSNFSKSVSLNFIFTWKSTNLIKTHNLDFDKRFTVIEVHFMFRSKMMLE